MKGRYFRDATNVVALSQRQPRRRIDEGIEKLEKNSRKRQKRENREKSNPIHFERQHNNELLFQKLLFHTNYFTHKQQNSSN